MDKPEQNNPVSHEELKAILEQHMLLQMNDYVFKAGLITDREYFAMRHKIMERHPVTKRGKTHG